MRALKAEANALTDAAAAEKFKMLEARQAGEQSRSQIVEVRSIAMVAVSPQVP